jgi:hypothetical protein
MIKDQEDHKAVEDIIKKNYGFLKKCFIHLASKSSFPNITSMDLGNFMQKCNIMDKWVNVSTVDRLFIATNTRKGTEDKSKANVANAL